MNKITELRFPREVIALSAVLFSCTSITGLATAGQLKEARVTEIIKDVKLLPSQAAPRPATVNVDVREGTAVRTGQESRSELTFTDRTLARLGANTLFSFDGGTRKLDLGGGAMLLYVPKGAGGAQIKTAAVTAAITGTTVLFEFHKNPGHKFIVLEGVGRLFETGNPRNSIEVHAGEMVIGTGGDLGKKVSVDLNLLLKKSGLINGFTNQLPSRALMLAEAKKQDEEKSEGTLVDGSKPIDHTDTLDQNAAALPTAPPLPTKPPGGGDNPGGGGPGTGG